MTTLVTRATKGSVLSYAEGDANIKRIAQTKGGAYTVAESDNRDVIEVSASATITLPDATTIAAAADTGDFEVTIKNVSGTTVTVTCTTGADTIEGSTGDYTLYDDACTTFKVNQAANGYNIVNGDVTQTGAQTLTNKTLTSPTIGTDFTFDSVTFTAVETAAEGVSASDVKFPTSNAVKTYADAIASPETEINVGSVGQGEWSGLPAGIKQFTISLDTVSATSDGYYGIRLGDATTAGYVTTGYVSGAGTSGFTNRVALTSSPTNARLFQLHGSVLFTHQSGNTWTWMGVLHEASYDVMIPIAGSVTLGGELDRVILDDADFSADGNGLDNGTANLLIIK